MPGLRCSLLRVKDRSKRSDRTNSKASMLESKFEKNLNDASKRRGKFRYTSITNTQNCSNINNNHYHNDNDDISHSRDVNFSKNKKSMRLFSFLKKEVPTPSHISPTNSIEIWDEGTKDSTIETDDYSSNYNIQQENSSTSTNDTPISLQPISYQSLEMASFSDPVPQEELSTSALTQFTPVTQRAFPSNLTQTKTRDQTKAFTGKSYSSPFNVVPLDNKNLSLEDTISLSHLQAELSMDTEPDKDGKFRLSMNDKHPDLLNDTYDLGQQKNISEARTSSRSYSEKTGRPEIANRMISELNSENSFSIHSNNADLDESNAIICKEYSSDNKSEGTTASSYTYIKELYLNNLGEKEEEDLITPNSSFSDLSILGLFEDSKSCHSCVVSFDSMEFPEDEQFNHCAKGNMSCSISIHDISTTYEDNDIVVDDEIHLERSETNQECQSLLLNRELDGRILQLSSQGMGDLDNFSSITYDSYISERGNSPRQSGHKKYQDMVNVDINDHEAYINEVQPILQQPFKNEHSQFILETSNDSVCSYDSFSSKSLKYMLDILKEGKERRSNNMLDQELN